ncbi:hypothetical protein ACIP88_33835 [Streptomyces uncialis]
MTARLRAARLAVLGLPDITHAPADLLAIATGSRQVMSGSELADRACSGR